MRPRHGTSGDRRACGRDRGRSERAAQAREAFSARRVQRGADARRDTGQQALGDVDIRSRQHSRVDHGEPRRVQRHDARRSADRGRARGRSARRRRRASRQWRRQGSRRKVRGGRPAGGHARRRGRGCSGRAERAVLGREECFQPRPRHPQQRPKQPAARQLAHRRHGGEPVQAAGGAAADQWVSAWSSRWCAVSRWSTPLRRHQSASSS